jgi:cobalt/nickel transport system permease protein
MNHSYLDEYSHIDSIISRLDVRVKIISFVVFLLFIVFARRDSFLGFALFGFVILFLIGISKIPVRHILKRCLIVVPFIFVTSICLVLGDHGTSVSLFHVGGFRISATAAGWIMFGSVMIKGVLSVLCLTLLTASTPFPRLLAALENMNFPRLITMIFSFMYRYIFLIEDEAMKMWRAMKSRSAGGSCWMQIKAVSNMIGILFIRSYERGEMVYLAMCSRGFDGTLQQSCHFDLKRRDLAFLFNISLALTGIAILDNFLGR